jgi:hypothetical protein
VLDVCISPVVWLSKHLYSQKYLSNLPCEEENGKGVRTISAIQVLAGSPSKISSSAILSLGMIEQGNGIGRLDNNNITIKPLDI